MDGWANACEMDEYIRSSIYYEDAFLVRRDALRNSADRFVDSYKISRKLRKHNIGLLYGRHPDKSLSGFCFCKYKDDETRYDLWKKNSRFVITEEVSVPLLALVESVLPYYYNYYQLICFEQILY